MDRGVRLDRTYQLNFGGNTDFLNMLERERLESKKISKTNAVTSMLDYELESDDVHVGPSDHVPWLQDRKWCYIRMEGTTFGNVPLNVELKLEVWDSPNSAGVVIDAVRCAKLAQDRGVGGALLHRGITGHCYAYQAAGIDTAHETGMDGRSEDTGLSERGIEIRQTLQVNKSADELYAYWRDFTNLPRIMTYLESVRVDDADGRRSHWVAKAPKLAGGKVEWDAELTADEPGRRVAWRSLQGGDIDTDGEVRFVPGLGDRGTEVHVNMRYVPPGGRLGHMLTSLMGENPKRVVREDLRNFKRVMEIGEVLTTLGQSHGTCTGKGKPYTESDWKPLFT